MSIKMIDPEQLFDNPYQPRSSYPRAKIDEIAYSIEQVGLIHTPKARQVNGHYELAEGHLRKRAFIKLKKKDPKKWGEMPIEVVDIANEMMAIIALEENLRRQDITPMDQARAVDRYLVDFPKETEIALAKKLNMTQGNVSNMRRVTRLPAKILEKVDDGRINFTMARELLIFQGLKGEGEESRWSRKEGKNVSIPRDDAWLMVETARKLRTGDTDGYYGRPCTVEGIKRAIHDTCVSQFRHLEKNVSYSYSGDPLFDTRAAGCLKCEHMIRAYETKSQAHHFCTKPSCWQKKQEAHIKMTAAAATKKMEAEIATRITEAESQRVAIVGTAEPSISQEIISKAEAIAKPTPELIPTLEETILTFATHEEVCKGCVNTKKCDGTGVHAVETTGGGALACLERVTKENFAQVKTKAIVKMPAAFEKIVRDQAGTRAEVLDLRELRLGTYRDELKMGFALLDEMQWSNYSRQVEILKMIDDPEECLERCIKGFHYAYDSSRDNGNVRYVCSDPKCLSKKKGAFTRARNAEGMAKKKAERAAIKEAVGKTNELDKPRMILILIAQCYGRHTSERYYSDTHSEKILAKRLGVELASNYPDGPKKKRQQLVTALEKLNYLKLAQIIVEFMLDMLTYEGEVIKYEVLTTEELNRMGVGVNVTKKTEKEEPVKK